MQIVCLKVDLMDSLFKSNRGNPPLYKNQPPVAGAILWEKSLFHRIKRTMLQFLPVHEMMSLQKGQQAKTKYLSVARGMKAYSDALHKQWYARVEQVLPDILRQTLLVKSRMTNLASVSSSQGW